MCVVAASATHYDRAPEQQQLVYTTEKSIIIARYRLNETAHQHMHTRCMPGPLLNHPHHAANNHKRDLIGVASVRAPIEL